MDSLELAQILSQEEGLKLDFKREYALQHTEREVRVAKWNEFVKDVLALTNGNVGTADQPGYLVIGAGDTLRSDGTRQLFDVRAQGLRLNRQQILEKVNACCHPPIPDLFYYKVEILGNQLVVIEIPPSPFVHETTRRLEVFDTVYSEATVFVRRTEGIYPATQAEREALTIEKQKFLEGLSASAVLEEAGENYRHHLVMQHRELDFKGLMQTARPLALPLKDVFVSLQHVSDVPETDTMESWPFESRDGVAGRKMDSDRLSVRESALRKGITKRHTISEIIARDPAFVILGEPGAGKTTILRYITLTFAEGQQERRLGIQQRLLPIFVPLASYGATLQSDDSMGLRAYLSLHYEQEHGLMGIAPLFEHHLNRGEAIVLLDGLDEVMTQDARILIARRTRSFVDAVTAKGNKVIMTSRVVGYREAPLPGSLPHYTILRFNDSEIRQFAKRWCQAYEIWLAGEDSVVVRRRGLVESEKLVQAISSHAGVKELAANPLLLTILSLIHRQENKLPSRRIELYEIYARTLIERWGRARSLSGRAIGELGFDYNRITKILAQLSLWMHRERAMGTARRVEIVQRIRLTLERMGYDQGDAEVEAERLLDNMRRYSGLLVERGRDAYGFMHPTFQEYFAARAIAMLRPGERQRIIHENLHNPRWREVILLAVGQVGSMDLREDEVSELVRGIFAAHSWGNEYVHHDLFLAASCMADDVGLDPRLAQEIIDALGVLFESDIRLLVKAAAGHLSQCPPGPLQKHTAVLALHGLSSQHSWTRLLAVEILDRIEVRDDRITDAFKACLGDKNWQVRHAATQALHRSRVQVESHGQRSKTKRSSYWQEKEERFKELTGVSHGEAVNYDEISEDCLVKLLDFGGYVLRPVDFPFQRGHYGGEAMLSLLSREHLEMNTIRQIVTRLTQYGKYERRDYHESLTSIAFCNSSVVEKLVEQIAHPRWQIRQAAIRALGKLGRGNPHVMEVLLLALVNDKWQVKQAAGRAIGEFGASTDRIDAALIVAADHTRWEVRQAAVRSLGQVGSCGHAVGKQLVDALGDEAWLVRWTAFKVVPEYVKRCERFMDLLLRAAIEHRSAGTRHSAVCLIGEFRDSRPQRVQAVLDATRDDSEAVRQAAVAVLGELGQWTAAVQRRVKEALNDDSIDVRGKAASVLVAFGDEDPTLEKYLVTSLIDSERQRVRASSEQALGRIGSALPATIHALLQAGSSQTLFAIAQNNITDFLLTVQRMELSKKGNATVRQIALEVLDYAGPLDEQATDGLLTLAKSTNWESRAFAGQALAYTSRNNESAVVQLVTLLHDRSIRVRDAAVYALSRLAGSPYLDELAGRPFVWAEKDRLFTWNWLGIWPFGEEEELDHLPGWEADALPF